MDGHGLRAGGDEFMDGTARSRARWKAALEELEAAVAVENVAEGTYRATALGYDIADDAARHVSPFDEYQSSHVRALIEPLASAHRDLLRFLLLQGGASRTDVVYRGAVSQVGLDVGSLSRPLVQNGLISQTDNPSEGYSILAVNDQIASVLRRLLYPRSEGNSNPFFKGI